MGEKLCNPKVNSFNKASVWWPARAKHNPRWQFTNTNTSLNKLQKESCGANGKKKPSCKTYIYLNITYMQNHHMLQTEKLRKTQQKQTKKKFKLKNAA